MDKLARILTLIVITAMAPLAFGAGDYIWEAKFKKELPKAEQGDVKSQYAVGEMYEKGRGAVRDLNKAFEWYSKAADQGNDKAAYKVGLSYLKGNGVNKDYKKAHSWFKKSADMDYVRAQYYLGEMYENGQGVLKDYDEASKWYKRALAGGYSNAADGIKRVAKAQKTAEQRRRAEKVVSVPKPKPKAQSSSKPKAKPKSTVERVMDGGWKKRNKPVEYLPSAVTKCKFKNSRVECLSRELTRNIGMADINYTTKAILFSFKTDGSFKVSYRNNVSKITVTDEDFAESGGKVPVKLGWQDAEHKLACNVEDDKEIVCQKNKMRTIKITR
jgi:hypothetical protein